MMERYRPKLILRRGDWYVDRQGRAQPVPNTYEARVSLVAEIQSTTDFVVEFSDEEEMQKQRSLGIVDGKNRRRKF